MSPRRGEGSTWPRPVGGGRPLAPRPDPRDVLATLVYVPPSPPELRRSWLDLDAADYPPGGET